MSYRRRCRTAVTGGSRHKHASICRIQEGHLHWIEEVSECAADRVVDHIHAVSNSLIDCSDEVRSETTGSRSILRRPQSFVHRNAGMWRHTADLAKHGGWAGG